MSDAVINFPRDLDIREAEQSGDPTPFRSQLLRVGVLIAATSGLAEATQDIDGARRGIDAEIDGDTSGRDRAVDALREARARIDHAIATLELGIG